MTITGEYKDWSGGYPELVKTARRLIAVIDDPRVAPADEVGLYAKAANVNERLVRQYVAAGVVDSGTRSGRHVEFGFRQLLQLVTARHLVAVERWKLPQITKLTATADISELARLLPSRFADELTVRHPANEETGFEGVAQSLEAMYLAEPEAPFKHLLADSERRSQFRREVESIRDMENIPEAEEWFRFRLTPWTEVHIERFGLEVWSEELVDILAEKLKQMLRAATSSVRRPRSSK
jgi:hypothetical protein